MRKGLQTLNGSDIGDIVARAVNAFEFDDFVTSNADAAVHRGMLLRNSPKIVGKILRRIRFLDRVTATLNDFVISRRRTAATFRAILSQTPIRGAFFRFNVQLSAAENLEVER